MTSAWKRWSINLTRVSRNWNCDPELDKYWDFTWIRSRSGKWQGQREGTLGWRGSEIQSGDPGSSSAQKRSCLIRIIFIHLALNDQFLANQRLFRGHLICIDQWEVGITWHSEDPNGCPGEEAGLDTAGDPVRDWEHRGELRTNKKRALVLLTNQSPSVELLTNKRPVVVCFD